MISGQFDRIGFGGLTAAAGIGICRLTMAVWQRDRSLVRLPAQLAAAGIMHLINTAAFWAGLIGAVPLRRRWR